MASRHWWYFGGFVVSVILLAGVALAGLLDAVSVLSSGAYNETFLLLAMLGEAAEWVGLAFVVGLIAFAFLVATVVSVLRNGSVPRDDRLVTLVELLERKYPALRRFDVSEKVEPTTEDRRRQLKKQYVEGEITEAEFEREVESLMDDSDERV